jgi:hypothetical protein
LMGVLKSILNIRHFLFFVIAFRYGIAGLIYKLKYYELK